MLSTSSARFCLNEVKALLIVRVLAAAAGNPGVMKPSRSPRRVLFVVSDDGFWRYLGSEACGGGRPFAGGAAVLYEPKAHRLQSCTIAPASA